MGMFDHFRCEYPLPIAAAQNLEFQTKDTPSQFLDLYKIDKDGMLWYQAYDIEDRSDPSAKGIERMFGALTRVNKRWVAEPYTGEIRFYTHLDEAYERWIEFSAYFTGGKIQVLNVIADGSPRK